MSQSQAIKMEFWDRDHSLDGDGNLHSATIPYIVSGFTDAKTMLDYAYTQIPKKLENLIDLDSIEITEHISEDVWKVVANYPHVGTNPTESGKEVPEFSFEMSSGTKHITHAITHIGQYAPSGETAPDYKGLINVTENGVEGADILNSTFVFTEKHYYSNSKMTNNFKRQISELVGKVNSSSFRGWNAGEVLFTGATGSRQGKTSKDKWEVVFKFNVSINRTNVTIDDITVPAVKGWEFLWVKYKKSIVSNVMVDVPASAHLEQVYESASFSILE